MIGLLQVAHSAASESFGIAHLEPSKGTTFVIGVSGGRPGPLSSVVAGSRLLDLPRLTGVRRRLAC